MCIGHSRSVRALPALASIVAACAVSAPVLAQTAYKQTNLVSDGTADAVTIDPNLKNPWGLVQGPTPFWISNQMTGVSTLYDANGIPQPAGSPLVVTVPAVRDAPKGPTGIAFNGSDDFTISQGPASEPARFIFVGLDGSVSGWNPTVNATNAVTAINDSDRSIFTGVTIAPSGGSNHLYIANGLAGVVDVKGPDFLPATLAGDFTDPDKPEGLVPFNVAHLGGKIYVSYAIPGPEAREEEEGSGAVSVFDTEGNLLDHLIEGGPLASPWGMTLAPESFGDFGGALLVGNFNEEGHINAFDPETGEHLGTLSDASGDPIENDELWALQFGNGSAGASPDTLFFTAGINDEAGGLFGRIDVEAANPIPLPNMMLVAPFVLGLAGFAGRKLRGK